MHPLRQYLFDAKEPVRAFAARVGASRQTLYRIFNGDQAPRPQLARRIVEATGGAVGFDALYQNVSKEAEIYVLPPSDHQVEELDPKRLKMALAIVCDQLTPSGEIGPPDAAYAVAAEAVTLTYEALSTVTSRSSRHRLQQALRPILGEMLSEYLETEIAPSALDQTAELARELYYHRR